MAAALIVVLLVASGEADDPATRTAVRVAQAALDQDAIVVVREGDREVLTEAEVTRVASGLHADTIVVLRWQDNSHRDVLVRARSVGQADWTDRTLRFAEVDRSDERGRTIGFEIAAMVPRRWSPSFAVPSERLSPAAVAAPRASSADRAGTRPTFALDAVASGVVGRSAGWFGGDLAGRLWFLDGWTAGRVVAGVRFGDIPAAGARLIMVRLGAGIAMRFVRPHVDRQPFGLGARMDALALWHDVSRTDGASSGSRLVPGVDAMFEASWLFARSFEVLLGVGAEVALGATRVFVDDRQTATIEPVRGIAELGLRWEY